MARALAVVMTIAALTGSTACGNGKEAGSRTPATTATETEATTTAIDTAAIDGTPRRSPAGSISFVRGPSIFLTSPDGKRLSPSLRGTGTDDFEPGSIYYSDPAWSPNGRFLAVRREEATESHGYDSIVVFRAGKVVTYLPGGESSITGNPSWAPDNRSVVLVGYQSGEHGGGLYIQQVGSDRSAALAGSSDSMDGPFNNTPAWSPDGTSIAFARTAQGRTALYVIRPDGRGLRRLTHSASFNPSWSPDGKHLVFDTGRRLAVIDADGRNLRYLTNHPGRDVDPAWSPDGGTIAFVRFSTSDSLGDLWLIDADGQRPRLIVRNATQPAWTLSETR